MCMSDSVAYTANGGDKNILNLREDLLLQLLYDFHSLFVSALICCSCSFCELCIKVDDFLSITIVILLFKAQI
jgi:hypothetical protein